MEGITLTDFLFDYTNPFRPLGLFSQFTGMNGDAPVDPLFIADARSLIGY